jgi:hypothetical protein
LSQLRNLPGASGAETAWRSAAAREHGWLTGPDAAAAGCDATMAPLVTGHLDPAALDRLVEVFLTGHGLASGHDAQPCGCRCGGCTCPARTSLSAPTLARLRGSLLAMAADVLSGPAGLAAWLRQSQLAGGPGARAAPWYGSPGRLRRFAATAPTGAARHPGRRPPGVSCAPAVPGQGAIHSYFW